MNKELLIDYLPFSVKPLHIHESMSRNGGRLIVSGVLQRANSKNQNSRIYPKEILEREVERYINIEIAERRALGELDHPDSSVINLRNVSHNILECKWEGDDLIGKIEILNTPSGNILKELFKANVAVGISSRGLGSVKELHEGDDTVEVQPDYSLVGWDFVSNPSTHGAFMSPLEEGVTTETVHKYMKVDNLVRDIICELAGTCCHEK